MHDLIIVAYEMTLFSHCKALHDALHHQSRQRT